MFEALIKYLKSLRFTLLVISLLGVMFLAGLWIPQERMVAEDILLKWQQSSPTLVGALVKLGFLHIYTSPLMLTLWGMFFLNLSLVMWQRLPLLKKRIAVSASRIADPETASGYSYRASFPVPARLSGDELLARLGKERYTLLGDAGGFFAVKNRLSPLAFGLFHLSFFLVLVGGVTSAYTKFMGVVEVAEGETFQGELNRYEPTPALAKVGPPPQVAFTIKSIKPSSVNGTATGLEVVLQDRKGVRVADVNRPYRDDHATFVVDNVGVAPLFIVKDAAGKELDGAYMKLHVIGGKQDVFSLAGYHFRVLFYPDYYLKDGQPATRSVRDFKNPMFQIAVEHKGVPVASGLVPPQGTLAFDNYQLVLQHMPLWVRFSVIKEYGLSIIYAGFAVASIAIIWRFLFYRRELVGALREKEGERTLVVACRSEFYKSLAEDEFKELFDKITG